MWSKVFLSFLSMLLCVQLYAQDLGVSIGLRSDSADSSVSGTKVNAGSSVAFGLLGRFLMSDRWGLRTGMFYNPRQYSLSTGGGSVNYKFSSFDIPVSLMYWLSEGGGLFVGAGLSLGLDKDCGPGSCTDYQSSSVFYQLGASFKLAPQFGLEAFYEQMSSAVAQPLSRQNAVGINLFFTFD